MDCNNCKKYTMDCDNCGLGGNGDIDIKYKGTCDGVYREVWSHYPGYLPFQVDYANYGLCVVNFLSFVGSKYTSSFNVAPNKVLHVTGGIVTSFYITPVKGSSAPNSCDIEIYLDFITDEQ